jgi:hypothetical protein
MKGSTAGKDAVLPFLNIPLPRVKSGLLVEIKGFLRKKWVAY